MGSNNRIGVFDRIYLVGNGRIADDCLKILSNRNVPVIYIEVYTEKFSFTKKMCERLGIKFLHYDKNEIRDYLLGIHEKTLIFSVHNSYIFPKEIIDKENITILNMHIALLPMYRGMNAPTWEIFDQQEWAGVTWHEVATAIDAGRIIDQKSFRIGPDDTAMKVLQASFRAGVELFEKNLNGFLFKSYNARPLKQAQTRLYRNKDLPNDGYMDDEWSFEKTYAFLRSLDYSGANLMRLPRVRKNEKSYEVTRYVKYEEESESDIRIEQWIDDMLILKWGRCCLKCTIRDISNVDLE